MTFSSFGKYIWLMPEIESICQQIDTDVNTTFTFHFPSLLIQTNNIIYWYESFSKANRYIDDLKKNMSPLSLVSFYGFLQ